MGIQNIEQYCTDLVMKEDLPEFSCFHRNLLHNHRTEFGIDHNGFGAVQITS